MVKIFLWFVVFRPDKSGLFKPDIETQQVASHVGTKAGIVMEADENDDW